MITFEHDVEVSGVKYRFNNARKFVRRSKRRLYFERDTNNRHDPYSIRVIGKYKHRLFEGHKCIGYVPTDVAKQLVAPGLVEKVSAQLSLLWMEDKNYMAIRFDIVGSKDDYEKYRSYDQQRVSSAPDRLDRDEVVRHKKSA